jgi:hypothetical protein
MKKLLLALAFAGLSIATINAQSIAPATNPARQEQAVKQGSTSKQGQAVTNERKETKEQTSKSISSGTVTKKDGTPDKRYSENKNLKKDGTPDKRFKEHKEKNKDEKSEKHHGKHHSKKEKDSATESK